MQNHVLYFVKPNEVNIRQDELPSPNTDELLIKNIASGISAGTEMLMFRGLMPNHMSLDANLPHLQQIPSYPFKYGYASVGKIIDVGNSKLKQYINKKVFAFHPHESYFCAKEEDIIILPEDIDPYDALFIPNMETAINFILDATPQIGDNIMILGLGMLGILTATLLTQFPLTKLTAVDHYSKRRQIGLVLGIDQIYSANDVISMQNQFDLVFELSGNPLALNTAIQLACFEGRILLGSWYGKKEGAVDLGGQFHRNRIKLISSQVSTLASELQGRWNKKRRLNLALQMIEKIRPASFITHRFSITEAMQAYELLNHKPEETLQVVLTYE